MLFLPDFNVFCRVSGAPQDMTGEPGIPGQPGEPGPPGHTPGVSLESISFVNHNRSFESRTTRQNIKNTTVIIYLVPMNKALCPLLLRVSCLHIWLEDLLTKQEPSMP